MNTTKTIFTTQVPNIADIKFIIKLRNSIFFTMLEQFQNFKRSKFAEKYTDLTLSFISSPASRKLLAITALTSEIDLLYKLSLKEKKIKICRRKIEL